MIGRTALATLLMLLVPVVACSDAPLSSRLLDEQYDVWAEALNDLRGVEREEQWAVGDDLLKVIEDRSSPSRPNAIRAIGHIKPAFSPAKRVLLDFVENPMKEHGIRWQAIIALGEMQLADEETITALRRVHARPECGTPVGVREHPGQVSG